MPVISLRVLIICKKQDLYLVKRFPTVELRAKYLGKAELNQSDEILLEDFLIKAKVQKEEEFTLYAHSLEDESNIQELLEDLKRIVILTFHSSSNKLLSEELIRNSVLMNLNKAIPFGIPIQTEPSVICGEFSFPKEGKCQIPINGRALPNWFPGPPILNNHSSTLKRLTPSILSRSPDASIWIEETVNAILYQHEDEFKTESNLISYWAIYSSICCLNRCKTPNEINLNLNCKNKDVIFSCHECVQRVENDGFNRIVFTPPPPLNIYNNEDNILEICRWRVDQYLPSLPIGWEEEEDCRNRILKDDSILIHQPLRATYRLRQATTSSTEMEYQIIVRLSCSLDRYDRPEFKINHLTIKLLMPSFFQVQSMKLQVSSGKVEYQDCFVIWTVSDTIFNTAGTALLSGIVFCSSIKQSNKANLNFFGETSCALIDFEFQGIHSAATNVNITSTTSLIESAVIDSSTKRIVKSGIFIVWNPFGDFPHGVSLDFINDLTV